MYKVKKPEFLFAINVTEQKKLLQHVCPPYQLEKIKKSLKPTTHLWNCGVED